MAECARSTGILNAQPRMKAILDNRLHSSAMSRGRCAFLPPKDDSTTAFGPDSALVRVVESLPRPESRREWS